MLTVLLSRYGKKIFPILGSSLLVICSIITTQPLRSQVFTQPGFNQVLVANGISNPTVMAFAPDGRLFVAQQSGELRIIENGILLPTPAITLSVNSSCQRVYWALHLALYDPIDPDLSFSLSVGSVIFNHLVGSLLLYW